VSTKFTFCHPSVPGKVYLIPSGGFTMVHKCDRYTLHTDRPNYGICNMLSAAPSNTVLIIVVAMIVIIVILVIMMKRVRAVSAEPQLLT